MQRILPVPLNSINTIYTSCGTYSASELTSM